jgi:hypothetical protein
VGSTPTSGTTFGSKVAATLGQVSFYDHLKVDPTRPRMTQGSVAPEAIHGDG